jgi:tetratricopeptide (TPR) repeat protein
MDTFAMGLFMLGLLGLIISLFSPKAALFFISNPRFHNSKKALQFYALIIVTSGIIGSQSEEYQNKRKAELNNVKSVERVSEAVIPAKTNDKYTHLTSAKNLSKLIEVLNEKNIDVCDIYNKVTQQEVGFERQALQLYQTQVKDSSDLFKIDTAFQKFASKAIAQDLPLSPKQVHTIITHNLIPTTCESKATTSWSKLSKAQLDNKIQILLKESNKDSLKFYSEKAYDDYQFKDSLGLALKHYNKALSFADTSAKETIAEIYIGMGEVYKRQKNKFQMMNYLRKAYNIEGKGGKACELLREETAQKIITGSYTYSECCDGTTSEATGRGACSHHKGVCNTVTKHSYGLRYTMSCDESKK